MINQPAQKQESPGKKPPSVTETGSANPTDADKAAQDDLTKNFQEELAKKREQHEEKIVEQKKKFRQTGSIGKANMELMSARQINRVRAIASDKEAEFAKLVATQKSERQQMILGQAESEMMTISENYSKIIDYVRGLDRLDEQEMARLEAIMEAMSKMKADPELEKVFQKALNKSTLEEKDLAYVVEKISPVSLDNNLSTAQGKTQQMFEAGQVGAVISVIKDGPQFMELMKMIIQKKNPEDTRKIIEILLTVGVLSNLQLQHLIDSGTVNEPTASALKQSLEKGELTQKQKDYQHMTEELGKQNKGRTAENPMSKTFSGAGAMALAGLWGVATMLVNIKAGWDSSKGFGQNVADVVSNPYVLMGGAAAVGGAVLTAPIVAPEKFERYKDKFLDFWKGPEEKREAMNIREQQLRSMLEDQLIRNPYLLAYLEEKEEFAGGRHLTGVEVIKDLVAGQRTAKKPVSFTFKELSAHSGTKQKDLLTKAMSQEGGKDVNFEDTIRAVMAALTHLKMDNPASVSQLAKDIKAKQGIK